VISPFFVETLSVFVEYLHAEVLVLLPLEALKLEHDVLF